MDPHHGLARCISPNLAFVYLSRPSREDFSVICGAVAAEQFGYGFGFTAFMLYLLYFSDGPHCTAHYADLHRVHGAGVDDPRHVERRIGGGIGVSAFLYLGALLGAAGICHRLVAQWSRSLAGKAVMFLRMIFL